MSAVKQSGDITPGHLAVWATDGVIEDGGTSPQGSQSNVRFIEQSGVITPGHIAVWTATGVLADGGTSPQPPQTDVAFIAQSGDVTPTHLAVWTADGVLADGGAVADVIPVQQSGVVTAGHGVAWLSDAVIKDAGGPGLQLNTGTAFFYSNDGANIWRIQDRLFVGEAADKFVGDDPVDTGTSWLSDTTLGPWWLGLLGQFVVTNFLDTRTASPSLVDHVCCIVGAARSVTGGPDQVFGVCGAVENAGVGATGWALYADVTHDVGAFNSYGLEIAVKNASGVNTIPYPNAVAIGAYGLWLSGGDDAYGPVATDPNAAAIAILQNTSTWNVGILMRYDALATSHAISLSSVGAGGAHSIDWYNNTPAQRGFIKSQQLTKNHGIVMDDTGVYCFLDSSPLLEVTGAVGAVNWITVFAHSTGNAPVIAATGTDTDVDLSLSGQGAGLVKFGSYTATPGAITGYITIKDSGGTSRKVAVTS